MKRNLRHDVTFASFESAAPVRKATVGRRNAHEGACLSVPRSYRCDCARHFLAVGTDILDGRTADKPGDPYQAFGTRQALCDAVPDKV